MRMMLEAVAKQIFEFRCALPESRSVLVAITGIDGSGKGYISAEIVRLLQTKAMRVASLHVDGWLNLPPVRFSDANPAEHFYEHAIRFDEMFRQLVFPLRDHRSVRITMDYAEETATKFRKQEYDFQDIDVIVIEGIYLLKQQFARYYDLSFWIECSFETALERAIARRQEGLPPAETIRSYHTIYFPAQEIHRKRDDPQNSASGTIPNDPKLDCS